MQPIIDVWFNKMHQILNDNTMFQVVSDLYTGVLPVQDNKPVIDQETYKKVLETDLQGATQGQIESLQITGIPKFTVELKLGEDAAKEAEAIQVLNYSQSTHITAMTFGMDSPTIIKRLPNSTLLSLGIHSLLLPKNTALH